MIAPYCFVVLGNPKCCWLKQYSFCMSILTFWRHSLFFCRFKQALESPPCIYRISCGPDWRPIPSSPASALKKTHWCHYHGDLKGFIGVSRDTIIPKIQRVTMNTTQPHKDPAIWALEMGHPKIMTKLSLTLGRPMGLGHQILEQRQAWPAWPWKI